MIRLLRALGVGALIALLLALVAAASLIAFGDPFAHAVVTTTTRSRSAT
jgi:hypothetical protein